MHLKKPFSINLKNQRKIPPDLIYIQNEVGRKRDVGSGTRPVQTQLLKKILHFLIPILNILRTTFFVLISIFLKL
jgi:hypothetical protein